MKDDLRSKMAVIAQGERYVTSHIKGFAPYWIHLYLCKHSALLEDNVYRYLYEESENKIVAELVQMQAQMGQATTEAIERENLKHTNQMQINSQGELIDTYGEFASYVHDLIKEFHRKT